jgi:hypothetical protein
MSVTLIIIIAVVAVVVLRVIAGAIFGLIHLAVILAVLVGVGWLVFGSKSIPDVSSLKKEFVPAAHEKKLDLVAHQEGQFGGSDSFRDSHGNDYSAVHDSPLPLHVVLSCKVRSRPLLDPVIESCDHITLPNH